MKYPEQRTPCGACKGHKQVAVIAAAPPLFREFVGEPLPMTYAEARRRLVNYRGNDGGALTMVVRSLANGLNVTVCPWCRGTGVAFVVRQLTPEEAQELRAAEEKGEPSGG